jgi:hypothetical protein
LTRLLLLLRVTTIRLLLLLVRIRIRRRGLRVTTVPLLLLLVLVLLLVVIPIRWRLLLLPPRHSIRAMVWLLHLRWCCTITRGRVLLLWLVLLLWRSMSSRRWSTIRHEGWGLRSWWSCCYMGSLHGVGWVYWASLLGRCYMQALQMHRCLGFTLLPLLTLQVLLEVIPLQGPSVGKVTALLLVHLDSILHHREAGRQRTTASMHLDDHKNRSGSSNSISANNSCSWSIVGPYKYPSLNLRRPSFISNILDRTFCFCLHSQSDPSQTETKSKTEIQLYVFYKPSTCMVNATCKCLGIRHNNRPLTCFGRPGKSFQVELNASG